MKKIANIVPENKDDSLMLKVYYGLSTGAKTIRYVDIDVLTFGTDIEYNEFSVMAIEKMIPKALDKEFNDFNLMRLVRQTKSLLEKHPEYLI